MGQGRNTIYLAQQGWDSVGFDPADRAVAAAQDQAAKLGVKITTHVARAEDFDWGTAQWDLIVLSYVGAREYVGKVLAALRPGGMADPVLFKRLSLLYFAAASFSETVRRLGRPHLAPGFLLNEHPRFGPELLASAALAAGGPTGASRIALFDRIDRAIEPFDAAGLLDRSRRDWYPVLASDLVSSASKLEASVDDVSRLLERCGLTATR